MTQTALEICMIAIQLCSSLHAVWDPLYSALVICIQPLSCLKKPLSSWSHNMNVVFPPGFFEGIVGGGGGQALWQGGGRNVRDYLFSLCVHSSPLGR